MISKKIFFLRISEICLLTFFLLLLVSSDVYSFPKGLDLNIQGKIIELYDDNVTLVHSSENKKKDFITRLRLGLGVRYEGKSGMLDVAGHINRNMYASHNSFNNSTGDIALEYMGDITKYDRIRLKNKFAYTFDPRSFDEAFESRGGRYKHYWNEFDLNYFRNIGKQFTVIVKYGKKLHYYSREDLQDSEENSYGIELDYMHNYATIFYVTYNFSRTKFDISGRSVQSVYAGMRKFITRQLYINGIAGVDFINSFENKENVKEYFKVSLTDDIDKNTSVSLSLTKSNQTFFYTDDVFDSWQISGSLDRQVLKRLSFAFSGFYGTGKFVSFDITERFKGANTAFSYYVTENITGKLIYRYSDKESTIETRGYRRNTVYLELIYKL